MAKTIRIKTSLKANVATIRCIVKHPMHTGFGINPDTQEYIPAHFIKQLFFYHNNELIMQCDSSRAISKNPYFSFRFSGAQKGDTLKICWIDNKDQTADSTFIIE